MKKIVLLLLVTLLIAGCSGGFVSRKVVEKTHDFLGYHVTLYECPVDGTKLGTCETNSYQVEKDTYDRNEVGEEFVP